MDKNTIVKSNNSTDNMNDLVHSKFNSDIYAYNRLTESKNVIIKAELTLTMELENFCTEFKD